MNKQNVLIPLDGSAFSAQVVAPALSLLDPARHAVVLLHVCAPPDVYTLTDTTGADDPAREPRFMSAPEAAYALTHRGPALDAEAQTTQALQAMAPAQAAFAAAGYDVRMEVLFGAPASAIESYVAAHEIDLVAMTTHGRAGLTRLLAGSVAEHVLRHVPVPVLMLRPKELRQELYTADELLKFT